MLLRELVYIWAKRYSRAEHLTARISEGVLGLIMVGVPVTLGALTAGLLLVPVVGAVSAETDGIAVAGRVWLCLCLAFCTIVPLLKKETFAPLRPFLVLPVHRRDIVNAYLGVSFLHLANGAAVLFLAAVWLGDIYGAYSPLKAVAWLAAALTMLLCAHLAGIVVRGKATAQTGRTLVGVFFVTGLLALDVAWDLGAVRVLADYLLRGILDGGMSRVLPLLPLAGAAYVMAFRSTTKALAVDAVSGADIRWSGSRVRAQGTFSRRTWVALMQLQVRLLLRNPRARFLLINVLTFTALGTVQLLFGLKMESGIFVAVGLVMLTAATGIGYAAHAIRLDSVLFDGLSVWPIESPEFSRAIVSLAHLGTVCGFLVALPLVALVRPDALVFFAAMFLYGIGIANPLFAFAATFETNRFDIGLSSFATKGALVAHPFLVNGCTLLVGALPLFLVFGAESPFGLEVYLPLAAVGAAGLLATGTWTTVIVRNLDRRRYLMREGFRGS